MKEVGLLMLVLGGIITVCVRKNKTKAGGITKKACYAFMFIGWTLLMIDAVNENWNHPGSSGAWHSHFLD